MTFQRLADPTATTPFVRPAKLNVYILDSSGSMDWAIQQLKTDTMTRIARLPAGDAVLIGVFSSPGWYRWIVARELTTQADHNHVASVIYEELRARETTCFSEILQDVPQALTPFLNRYNVIPLTFMSDGQPVVPNVQAELAALRTAAATLAPMLSGGAVVAYGDYANLPLLRELASILGVEFVMTEQVAEIGEAFTRGAESGNAPRRRVSIPAEVEQAFAMSPEGIITPLTRGSEAEVLAESTVYVRSDKVVGEQLTGDLSTIQFAATAAAAQQGAIDEVAQQLAAIGDVTLSQQFYNALTNAELGRAQAALRAAVLDPTKRFAGGCHPGRLPRDDGFDLLDLLTFLINDKHCVFYPYDPNFQYKRISRRREVRPGYPTFVADPHIAVPLQDLVGHESELNLSVRVKIPGHIDLPEAVMVDGQAVTRDMVHLAQRWDTHLWRNYALVANATPTTTHLPVTMSNGLAARLAASGVFSPRTDMILLDSLPSALIVLDLTKVPVCNRDRGRSAANWSRLAELTVASHHMGAILKVLRAKRDELDPKRESKQPSSLTAAQTAFLGACGLRPDGSFSPPVDTSPPADVIDVRVLETSVVKAPDVSMKEFEAMLAGERKLNYTGEQMQCGHALLTASLPTQKAAALAWLTQEIEVRTKDKRVVDTELNNRRFAIALTGAWPKSFSEDTAIVPAQGREVKLSFRTIQKKI